jgi:hypothetical protein
MLGCATNVAMRVVNNNHQKCHLLIKASSYCQWMDWGNTVILYFLKAMDYHLSEAIYVETLPSSFLMNRRGGAHALVVGIDNRGSFIVDD